MWEDAGGRPMFHGQWFSRGSETVLGESADPCELFLIDRCDDNPLGAVVDKVDVRLLQCTWHGTGVVPGVALGLYLAWHWGCAWRGTGVVPGMALGLCLAWHWGCAWRGTGVVPGMALGLCLACRELWNSSSTSGVLFTCTARHFSFLYLIVTPLAPWLPGGISAAP